MIWYLKSVSSGKSGISSIFALENHLQADKIVQEHVIGSTKTESTRKCAFSCLQNTACMAYFYHKNTTECRLMRINIPSESGSWKIEMGWQYFNVYEMTCPPHNGFSQNREVSLCYRYFSTPKTVADAQVTCHQNGGQLLQIDNRRKQDHLAKYLDFFTATTIYIQGSDSAKEGTWAFDDGHVMSYFNWNPTTPFGHDSRDFLVMTKASSYGWEETDGTTPSAFLCGLIL